MKKQSTETERPRRLAEQLRTPMRRCCKFQELTVAKIRIATAVAEPCQLLGGKEHAGAQGFAGTPLSDGRSVQRRNCGGVEYDDPVACQKHFKLSKQVDRQRRLSNRPTS